MITYQVIEDKVLNFLVWTLYLISLYSTIYFFLILIDESNNKKKKNKIKVVANDETYDLKNSFPGITVIIPAYNEEQTIKPTIESVFNLDYPKDKLKVICVDDGSKDNTLKILKELKKIYPIKIIHQKNQGKYAALNHGLKYTNTPFFACLDADSFVEKDALKKLLAEFDDKRVAVVMPAMKVYKPKNFLEIIQWLEYLINIFYKKLLEKINAIHVAPGPFSVYRTDIIKKLGGFRKAHLTEDLEMALRLQEHHYVLKQSLDSIVYTKVPTTWKSFYKQRIRWYYGTLMNVIDYKHLIFNPRYGDFGLFFFPLVSITGFLTLLGAILAIYVYGKSIYRHIKDLILTHFDLKTYWEWNFNVSWLDYDYRVIFSSAVLIIISIIVIYHAMKALKEKPFKFKHKSFLVLLFYFFGYGPMIAYSWFLVLMKVIKNRENVWGK